MVGIGAMASAALAGTPGTLPGSGSYVGGVNFPGPQPLVLWKLPGSGGRLGTCIVAQAKGPLTGPYIRERSIDDPVYAELNHLFATADTSDVRLAELSALNSAKYDRVDKTAQWAYVSSGSKGLSQADAEAMLAQARKLAGPYKVTVSWPAADAMVGVPYQATIAVHAASGAAVPGAVVSVFGSQVTLAATSATTNSAGVATVGFTIPAGSSSTFAIGGRVQQWTSLDFYRSAGEQTMVTTGEPTFGQGSHTGPVVRSRDVKLVKVAIGDAARRPVPGYVFRIANADGTVLRESVTTGDAPVDLGPLPVGATYTATETAVPDGGSLYLPPNATTTFTVPPGSGVWTLEIADPTKPQPGLRTAVSLARALVGQRLSDHVTVSGNDGEDGTITAKLYGPVGPPASGECAHVKLAAYQAAASAEFTAAVRGSAGGGNGVFEVVGPIVTEPGCYGWAETLTLRPSGVAVTSPPTAPNESSLVTRPEVRTVTSAPVASAGARLSDHVSVTGLNGVRAGLIGTLYGPLPVRPTSGCRSYDDAFWARAMQGAAGRLVAGEAHLSVKGDGEYDLGPVTVSRVGCYTWVETLTPVATGAAPLRTPFGVASESTVVIAPVLGTVATPATVVPGGSLRDIVSVGGTGGVPLTITGALLGPISPVGGSCAGLDWATAPVASAIVPIAVNHDGRYVTAPVVITKPGCYTFTESLIVAGMPPKHPVAVAKPGQPAETVLVRRQVTTLAATGVPVDTWLVAGLGLLGVGAIAMGFGSLRRRAR